MTWQSIYNYSVYSGLGNKRYNSRLGNIKSYCPSAPWMATNTIILTSRSGIRPSTTEPPLSLSLCILENIQEQLRRKR